MIHRLQRIVQEVNRAPDIERALVLITDSLRQDLKADACSIFLARENDPGTLVLKACNGLNPDIIDRVERKLGTGGSSGFDYLRRTADRHRIFSDLFALSTYFLPRSQLPPLPEELRRSMGYSYAEQPS